MCRRKGTSVLTKEGVEQRGRRCKNKDERCRRKAERVSNKGERVSMKVVEGVCKKRIR